MSEIKSVTFIVREIYLTLKTEKALSEYAVWEQRLTHLENGLFLSRLYVILYNSEIKSKFKSDFKMYG